MAVEMLQEARRHTARGKAVAKGCTHTAGRLTKGCPVSLELFAADVQLPEQLNLEMAVRSNGKEQLSIDLLDASSDGTHILGMLLCLP